MEPPEGRGSGIECPPEAGNPTFEVGAVEDVGGGDHAAGTDPPGRLVVGGGLFRVFPGWLGAAVGLVPGLEKVDPRVAAVERAQCLDVGGRLGQTARLAGACVPTGMLEGDEGL